jgi:steroid delta-isomerase-like uncharacterized protein
LSGTSIPLTQMTKEQLQAHFDERSLNTHDPDAVASHFSRHAIQRRVSTGEEAHGRDAIREVAAELFTAFPDFHVQVQSTFAAGNHVCAELTLRGTHEGEWRGIAPTHRQIEVDNCFLFRIGDDGLVEEETIYGDSATLLRQLGLLP